MEAPAGHEQNADQIAYWNGPGGPALGRPAAAQDILLAPVADILIDRAKPVAGERVIDVGCGSGATTIAFARKVAPIGPCAWHRHLRPDAGARAASCAEGSAGRFRAGRRHRLSVRPCKFRSAGLAVRRDVLRRSGAFVRQHAQGAAAVGPAGIRLLARAARKSVDAWRRCRRSTSTCRNCRRRGRKTPGRSLLPPRSACIAS